MLHPELAESFHSKYDLEESLGCGSYGHVWACTDRATGELFACKVVDGHAEHPNSLAALRTEIRIMEVLQGDRNAGADCSSLGPEEDQLGEARLGESAPWKQHPGVVEMKEAEVAEAEAHLVMELCRGGDLFELLVSRGRLPEASAKLLFCQIASAIAYCHARGVIHRDIKPENILLDSPAACLYTSAPANRRPPRVQAKLADFGLAALVEQGQSTSGYNGSRFYVAPEMLLRRPYDHKVDVWSLGVLLCAMLSGRIPFYGAAHDDREGLRKAILRGRVDFEGPNWRSVSEEAMDLVSQMLSLDPELRPTAEELLRHPWCRVEGFEVSQKLPGAPEGSVLEEADSASGQSDEAHEVAARVVFKKAPEGLLVQALSAKNGICHSEHSDGECPSPCSPHSFPGCSSQSVATEEQPTNERTQSKQGCNQVKKMKNILHRLSHAARVGVIDSLLLPSRVTRTGGKLPGRSGVPGRNVVPRGVPGRNVDSRGEQGGRPSKLGERGGHTSSKVSSGLKCLEEVAGFCTCNGFIHLKQECIAVQKS